MLEYDCPIPVGEALRSNESLRAWRQGLGLRALRINAIVDAALGLSVVPFVLVSPHLSHLFLGWLGSALFVLSGALKWFTADASGHLPASTRALSSGYAGIGAIALELFFGVGTAIAAPIGLIADRWARRVEADEPHAIWSPTRRVLFATLASATAAACALAVVK